MNRKGHYGNGSALAGFLEALGKLANTDRPKGVTDAKAPSANGRGKPRPAQRHPGIGDELLLRTGAFHNYSDPELHIIAGDFFIFPLTISVRTSNKQSSEKFETSQVEHPSYSDEMAVTCIDRCLYFHDIV